MYELDPLSPNGLRKKSDDGYIPYFAGGAGKPSLLDSVNGKHGAVRLTPGTNISIDTSDSHDIEISALENYTVANVKDFGAIGDGSTDDTTSIATAIASISATGGIVYFPAGVYLTGRITLPSLVILMGEIKDATVIKLKDTQNSDLIATTNFATLTGTDTTNGVYGCGIQNLTLDGNKDNNATGGNVISIYGYGYLLQNINIREGKGWGIWSEYGTQSLPTTDVALEAKIINFVVHDNHIGGIRFKGAHDSHIYDGVVYYNGHNQADSINIHVLGEGNSNGTTFHNVHSWGGTYEYSFYIEATGISLRDCQIEGSTIAHVVVAADQTILDNVKIFSIGTNIDTVVGIKLISSANNLYARAKFEDCGGGMINFNAGGDGHSIEGFGVHYSGGDDQVAIVGAIPANSFVRIWHLDGTGAEVDSILHFPGNVNLGDLQTTLLSVVPTTGDATASIEAASGEDLAEMKLTGHNVSNNGDYLTMQIRTDQPDVVASVYDSSAATFHEFFKYMYLNNRLSFTSNTITGLKGSYNTPAEFIAANFVSADDSDNAGDSLVSMMMRFNSGSYSEAAGKQAKISAIRRNTDFAATVDLGLFTSPTNSTTLERLTVTGAGDVGIGTTAPAKKLSVAGDIGLTTAGNGLYVKEGSNAALGTATLSAGTVVVSTTKVTTTSRIFLTAQSLGTVTLGQGLAVSARTAGTSFTILSQSAIDTSVVAWFIVEPS